jgi:hypothetical protein
LRVINCARQGLEAEQAYCLLVQLIHSYASEIAGRLKHGSGGESYRRGLLQPLQQQRKRDNGRMGWHHSRRKEINARRVRLQPGCTNHHTSLPVQSR